MAATNGKNQSMENQNSLLGVIETLYKWRKQILITTLIAAVGSSVIVLLVPVYYKSTTIFYAASPDLAAPEPLFGKTNESMEYYGDDEDIARGKGVRVGGEGEAARGGG
ncbi:MAG: hypothetical protein AAFU60_00475, partial [Bacteroidota bacterium]